VKVALKSCHPGQVERCLFFRQKKRPSAKLGRSPTGRYESDKSSLSELHLGLTPVSIKVKNAAGAA